MRTSERAFMKRAIAEAARSKLEDERSPRVGVVLVSDQGKLAASAHKGETGVGHHAEFALLEKKVKRPEVSKGATLYTTLEPCTTCAHEKISCAEWIVKKKVARVVIGILDPNPNACGRGYWRLVNAGIKVDFFPSDLAARIIKLNRNFVAQFRSRRDYGQTFTEWINRNKSPLIRPYAGLGWGIALSLLDCPDFREGWQLSTVSVQHDDDSAFSLPREQKRLYERYFKEQFEAMRFYDDRETFMLKRNPTAFSDSPSLVLHTMRSRFSVMQFYRDVVIPRPQDRTALIDELVRGSLEARFPNGLCMEMVVVTRDDRVLLTKRSPKLFYYPNAWSCSLEEQMRREDLAEGPEKVLTTWAKRALWEELALDEEAYDAGNLRVLSVFLQSAVLNISLCVYAPINLDSKRLGSILSAKPRSDWEFTEWRFLEVAEGAIIREMNRRRGDFHPTTGYRMLMLLLKRFGEPQRKSLEVRGQSSVTATTASRKDAKNGEN